jgi:hypothetical protein
VAIFTWSDNDVAMCANICICRKAIRKMVRLKVVIVRNAGLVCGVVKKQCGAVISWCFENLISIMTLTMNVFT